MRKEVSIQTWASGLQEPRGGSGGIGAPSLSKEQCSTLTSGKCFPIIVPDSWARVMVDQTIRVMGKLNAFNRCPVKSHCFLPETMF